MRNEEEFKMKKFGNKSTPIVNLIIMLLAVVLACSGCFFNEGLDFIAGSEPIPYNFMAVDPPVAVNTGEVPVTVSLEARGLDLSRFENRAGLSFYLSGPAVIYATSVVFGDTSVSMVFDCTDQLIGDYNLVVTNGQTTETLPYAFFLRDTVQSAILQASALYDDTSLVTAYLPPYEYNTNTEEFPIVLVNGVHLKGPGAGLLSQTTGRNGVFNAVLNAEDTERVIEVPEYTNYWGISGIEITGGYAQDRGDGNGGGIYWYSEQNSQSTPFITDCYIHSNYSSSDGAGVYISNDQSGIPETQVSTFDFTYNLVTFNDCDGTYGAGAYFNFRYHAYETNINNNEFSDNSFGNTGCYGGGFYLYSNNFYKTLESLGRSDYFSGTTNMNNNVLDTNVAENGYGGGVYVDSLGRQVDLNMTGNTFTDHLAVYEGAGAYVDGLEGGTFSFTDNTFTGNSCHSESVQSLGRQIQVRGYGGGLFLYNPVNSTLNFITGNTFTNNEAYFFGGGVYIVSPGSCQLQVEGNTFTGNIVDPGAGNGGGLSVSNSQSMQAETYHSNTFSQNTASYGGGMHYICAEAGGSVINDNTFAGNNGTYGGGLYAEVRGINGITGNRFNGNTAARTGGGLDYYHDEMGQYHVTYNVFNGNTVVDGDGGGIYLEYIYADSTVFAGNKIFGNIANTNNGSGDGGGVYLNACGGDIKFGGTSADYQNDIFNNTAATGNGSQFYNRTDSAVDANYNYWGGEAPTYPGDVFGNVDTEVWSPDPLP